MQDNDKLKHIGHPEAYRTLFGQLFLASSLEKSGVERAWQEIPDLERFPLAPKVRKDDACAFRKFPDYLTTCPTRRC